MDQYILGLSCYYHDSAAALLKTAKLLLQHKRNDSPEKHDHALENAVSYCLKSQGINLSDIKEVVYYENLLTFERLLETYLGAAPRWQVFCGGDAGLVEGKLFKNELKKNLQEVQESFDTDSTYLPNLLFSEHHLSHAAAAFYPSPFEESVVFHGRSR